MEVVFIPHNKGCGCQDGSTIDMMLRTLSNYADHPNVGGVILIDLGCEKTNLAQVEKYLFKREYKEYASKFGAVLNNNPSPGNIAGGLLEAKAETHKHREFQFWAEQTVFL